MPVNNGSKVIGTVKINGSKYSGNFNNGGGSGVSGADIVNQNPYGAQSIVTAKSNNFVMSYGTTKKGDEPSKMEEDPRVF